MQSLLRYRFFCTIIDSLPGRYFGFVFQTALTDGSVFLCVDCQSLCPPKLQKSVLKNSLFGCYKCPDINSFRNRFNDFSNAKHSVLLVMKGG